MLSGNVIKPSAGIALRFHPRILGTPAPVFPGYEIDIDEGLSDEDRSDAIWHRDRARRMISAHPEIRELIGHTPSTAFWCVVFVAAQIGIALALSGQPFLWVLLAAYVVGSLIDMNLFMLAHECNHSLVFRKPSWNRWLFTLTSAPMFMSGHHTWWIEHHIHHKDLGAKTDFIKRRRTFFLLTRPTERMGRTSGPIYAIASGLATPLFRPYALIMLVTQVMRSVLGLGVYVFTSLACGTTKPSGTALAILADEHLVPGYRRYGIEEWAAVFPLINLSLVAGLYAIGGWEPVVYLLASQLFQTGFLHPLMLGMILSNSHFHGQDSDQPSASHYGWLNLVTFNFGLHTEHHDIMRIPWSRLPKLRRLAPEFYDDLVQTPSYLALAMQYVFGSREGFDNEVHRNLDLTAGISNEAKRSNRTDEDAGGTKEMVST